MSAPPSAATQPAPPSAAPQPAPLTHKKQNPLAIVALVIALAGIALAIAAIVMSVRHNQKSTECTGPRGAQGARGATGATGPAGPVGPAGPEAPIRPVLDLTASGPLTAAQTGSIVVLHNNVTVTLPPATASKGVYFTFVISDGPSSVAVSGQDSILLGTTQYTSVASATAGSTLTAFSTGTEWATMGPIAAWAGS